MPLFRRRRAAVSGDFFVGFIQIGSETVSSEDDWRTVLDARHARTEFVRRMFRATGLALGAGGVDGASVRYSGPDLLVPLICPAYFEKMMVNLGGMPDEAEELLERIDQRTGSSTPVTRAVPP